MSQIEIVKVKSNQTAHAAEGAASSEAAAKAAVAAATKAVLEATVVVHGTAINQRASPGTDKTYEATGTGFFIDDKHILTDAHLADHILRDGRVRTYDGQEHRVHLVKLDDVRDLAEYELDEPTDGKYKPITFGSLADVAKGTPLLAAAYRPESGQIEINQGTADGIISKDHELAREQSVAAALNRKIGADPVPGIFDQYHKVVNSLDSETKKDALADLARQFVSAPLGLEGGASGAALFDLEGHLRGINAMAGYTYTPALASETRDLFTTLPTITAFLADKNSKFKFSYIAVQGHTLQGIERIDHSKRRPFNAMDDIEAKIP
jgi:S1-C subfamily serine protease